MFLFEEIEWNIYVYNYIYLYGVVYFFLNIIVMKYVRDW